MPPLSRGGFHSIVTEDLSMSLPTMGPCGLVGLSMKTNVSDELRVFLYERDLTCDFKGDVVRGRSSGVGGGQSVLGSVGTLGVDDG